jgi:hypothetical protein
MPALLAGEDGNGVGDVALLDGLEARIEQTA